MTIIYIHDIFSVVINPIESSAKRGENTEIPRFEISNQQNPLYLQPFYGKLVDSDFNNLAQYKRHVGNIPAISVPVEFQLDSEKLLQGNFDLEMATQNISMHVEGSLQKSEFGEKGIIFSGKNASIIYQRPKHNYRAPFEDTAIVVEKENGEVKKLKKAAYLLEIKLDVSPSELKRIAGDMALKFVMNQKEYILRFDSATNQQTDPTKSLLRAFEPLPITTPTRRLETPIISDNPEQYSRILAALIKR